MSLPPLLDPLHVGLVAEVIFVPRFSEPAPLALRFAGTATIRGQAEKLTAGIMDVGREEIFAATALAAVGLEIHRLQKREENRADINQ